jgi:predicted HicB family RNase H-like nuclease
MAQTDARRKASQKYQKEKVEEIKFRVPKGHKSVIQEHAAAQKESVNAFLSRAVKETMERDSKNQAASPEFEENDDNNA